MKHYADVTLLQKLNLKGNDCTVLCEKLPLMRSLEQQIVTNC